jgi:hypothetical protein
MATTSKIVISEDAPKTMREIVQKKFLDDVIGNAGKLI